MASDKEIADYNDIIEFKPTVAEIPNIKKLVDTFYKQQVLTYIDPTLSGDSTNVLSVYLYLHFITRTWEPFFADPARLAPSDWAGAAGAVIESKAQNAEIKYQGVPNPTSDDADLSTTTWGQLYLSLAKQIRQKIGVADGRLWVVV